MQLNICFGQNLLNLITICFVDNRAYFNLHLSYQCTTRISKYSDMAILGMLQAGCQLAIIIDKGKLNV